MFCIVMADQISQDTYVSIIKAQMSQGDLSTGVLNDQARQGRSLLH